MGRRDGGAQAPQQTPDHITRQCTAKAKHSGRRCTHSAIRGGTVCTHHGGNAPQVKAAAAVRIRELMASRLGVLSVDVQERAIRRALETDDPRRMESGLRAAKDAQSAILPAEVEVAGSGGGPLVITWQR